MIDLHPLYQQEGVWSIPDNILRNVWRQTANDYLVHRIFYGGEVQSEDEFLAFAKRDDLTFVAASENGVIAGFAFLNSFAPGHAFSHFCVFRRGWGKCAEDLGNEVLRYWFSWQTDTGKPVLRYLLGLTPADNQPALKFIKRLGFREVGTIPEAIHDRYADQYVDAVLSHARNNYGG